MFEIKGLIAPPAVSDSHSGSYRSKDYCAGKYFCNAQRRDFQMLWRRYLPKEKAVAKTKGREKTHATGGQCRSSPGSIYGCTQTRKLAFSPSFLQKDLFIFAAHELYLCPNYNFIIR